MTAIDMHAHVFNAAYLPLEGIARARGVPKALAWAFARILEGIVEDEELRQKDELHGALKAFSALPGPGVPGWEANFESGEDPITALAVAVRPEVLQANEAELDLALRELDRLEAEREPAGMKARLGFEAADARVLGLPAADLRRKLIRVLRRIADVMENGVMFVQWIVLLLRRESAIVDHMCETFPDVRLFVHHTMDLGPHYDPQHCSYPFKYRQLQRVRALTESYGGKLLPFVAYSPFREDGVELVKTWVRRGFAGVKFYPPSGYRPVGNTAEDLRNPKHDPQVVDERNMKLFAHCEDNGVPIFAHCQPGEFQQYRRAGCLSHPNGWRRVLEEYPRLRLCLGHAGGEGWTAAEGEEDADAREHCPDATGFISGAVELCVDYDNVYIEFGCMETILENADAGENLRTRIRRNIAQHGERFGKSIIYGSDWHMLARTPGVGDYLSHFRRMFEADDVLSPYAADFFSGNTLRFLDLPRFLERSAGHLSEPVRKYLERIPNDMA